MLMVMSIENQSTLFILINFFFSIQQYVRFSINY